MATSKNLERVCAIVLIVSLLACQGERRQKHGTDDGL